MNMAKAWRNKMLLGVAVALATGCSTEPKPVNAQPSPPSSTVPKAPKATPKAPLPAVEQEQYAWLASWDGTLPSMTTLQAKFPTPQGFERVAQGDPSFGTWLRGLPIRLDRTQVLSYQGDTLGSPAAAIVVLDLGKRNLQQCADSALRLHAEYRWSQKDVSKLRYHFTSGDPSSWSRWRRGERFKIEGRNVKPVMGKARSNTHTEFRNYLQHLFRYAGTQSLRFDSKAVASDAFLEPGDFLVQGGSPGHAVVILDVAVHSKDNRRVALIGQGFMPAQEFHVVRGSPDATVEGVWFELPEQGKPNALIDTPSWKPFKRSDARRFK